MKNKTLGVAIASTAVAGLLLGVAQLSSAQSAPSGGAGGASAPGGASSPGGSMGGGSTGSIGSQSGSTPQH